MNKMSLPEGWAKVKLGDVLLAVIGGGTPSRKNPAYFNGQIPWFTVKDMHSLRPNDAQEHISERAVQESATNIIPANTLIIATRIALGKAIKPTVACAINQDLKALITPAGINPDFLLYWIIANAQTIQELGSGTTVSGIRLEVLNNLEIDLPPSAEQTRIVEMIEEIFSDLDAGMAELTIAQKKFVQYRQSLLKSAVEGKLTATWRADNKPQENGEQLLARILVERRRRWEEKQLARFMEQDKTPPEDWQDKYPKPILPDTTDLPKLPQGWVWASLEMLGDIVSGVAKGTKRDSKIAVREVPYLRVANVQRGYLDLSEVKSILATERDIEELTLEKGDVLFNEGGDRDKLGRGWVWQGEVENCIHQNHVFRMRPYLTEVTPELISHHGNTFGKTWFQRVGKQTTNLASINMTVLRAFPVPLAPANEQREIVKILTDGLTTLDQQVNSVEKGLKQSEAQRKNILKSAFSGRLVPQNPSDGHISLLLESIHAERKAIPAKPKKKKLDGGRTVANLTTDSVRELLVRLHKDYFTFEELRDQVVADYETLKDIIFSLLNDKNPCIKQVFDEETRSMRFEWVKP